MLSVTVFQAALASGRLLGDRLVDRFGLGYLGSFTGPALIGSLAGTVGLVSALVVPAVAGGLTAAFARHVDVADREVVKQ